MYADLRHRDHVSGCQHKKVFSGEHLVFEDTPMVEGDCCVSWYWICDSCMEVGSDLFSAESPPETQPSAYWRLMRLRDPGCWMPNRYRN